MTSSCFFFLLQRKSLRDQWLMEGAPLFPASSNTQSPRSPLWGSEAQEMEEHVDEYSCGWVFFLLIMMPTFERFITIINVTEYMCVRVCVCLSLRLQSESQQLTEEEKEPMENRKMVGILHRCIHTHKLILLFFGQKRCWKMC